MKVICERIGFFFIFFVTAARVTNIISVLSSNFHNEVKAFIITKSSQKRSSVKPSNSTSALKLNIA